ncbi:hypothetical protein GCM10009415_30760 [Chitinophaga japonensis]
MLLQNVQAQTSSKNSGAIDQVVVFLQGAQVTRSMPYTLTPGNNRVVFSGISPDIDEKSIQVKVPADATLMSIAHQPDFIREQSQREEIVRLEKQREALQAQLDREKNHLQVYTQEEALLTKNQDIGGDNNGVTAAALKEVLDLHRQRLAEVLEKQLLIKQQVHTLEIELKKNASQLLVLRQQKETPTSDIILDVLSKSSVSGKFTVSYLVKHAGWLPAYDIRVKDITHPLDITFKAKVFQQCGEVWKQVKLQLSTGNPADNNVKPVLHPWYLRTYRSYEEMNRVRQLQRSLGNNEIKGRVLDHDGNPLPYATVQVKGKTLGTTTDDKGYFSLQSPGGEQTLQFSSVGYQRLELPARSGFMQVTMQADTRALEEVVVTGYALQGKVTGVSVQQEKRVVRKESSSVISGVTEAYVATTFYYDIPIPYTIEPDGKPYTVGVKELEVPASYEYYAVPKLDKAAFLVAGITGWESLNLLEGEASIYYEDTYLGKSLLDLQSSSDTLLVSLGRDKGVVVSRTLEKDYSRKRFIGRNITMSRSWQLGIRNNKPVPVQVILQDQLPIPGNTDITLSGVSYSDAVLDEPSNLLTWKMTLAPGTEQQQQLKYSVSFPKTAIVNID